MATKTMTYVEEKAGGDFVEVPREERFADPNNHSAPKQTEKHQGPPPFKFLPDTWNGIDKIVCVTQNAKPRNNLGFELRELAMHETHFVHNENKESSDRTSKDRSMFETYVTIIREALQDKSLQNIMIFSEDVRLLQTPTVESAHEMKQFLSLRHYDVFTLGAVPDVFFEQPIGVSGMKHIFKLNPTSASCMNILSRRFMERLAKLEYDTFRAPIEKVLATNQESYAILMPWFCQPSNANGLCPALDTFAISLKGWFAANSRVPLIAYVVIAIAVLLLLVLLLLCFK